MEKRRLGATDLELTCIGFGAWAIGGGGWAYGWGPQDDRESIAAIRRALDLGVNWIDTAAVYGLGHSEEVVARALAGTPKASRPFVFTKCGLVWDEKRRITHCLEADSIRREIEGSLRRLEVEVIDLYQIHWPALPASAPAPDLEEAWTALADLRRCGKVRHIGVSNFDVPQLERIAPIAPVASLQPPYSLVTRGIEAEVLPYCRARDIGVIVYSPMQSGLLSGSMTRERVAALAADDWRRNSPEFQEPRLSRNLALVEHLRAIGVRHGRSPGEVAIAWTLRNAAVTGAIVGARNAAQADGVMKAAEFSLSDADAIEIEGGTAPA